eukprot:547068-Prymnesium_polylepis.1
MGRRVCCITQKEHITLKRTPNIRPPKMTGRIVMPSHIWKGVTVVAHSGETTETSTDMKATAPLDLELGEDGRHLEEVDRDREAGKVKVGLGRVVRDDDEEDEEDGHHDDHPRLRAARLAPVVLAEVLGVRKRAVVARRARRVVEQPRLNRGQPVHVAISTLQVDPDHLVVLALVGCPPDCLLVVLPLGVKVGPPRAAQACLGERARVEGTHAALQLLEFDRVDQLPVLVGAIDILLHPVYVELLEVAGAWPRHHLRARARGARAASARAPCPPVGPSAVACGHRCRREGCRALRPLCLSLIHI